MNSVIECECGALILYNTATVPFTCGKCYRRWYSVPTLFSNDGKEAKKLPHLCPHTEVTIDDATIGMFAEGIRENHDNCPATFFVAFADAPAVEIQTSLRDFGKMPAYKMQCE